METIFQLECFTFGDCVVVCDCVVGLQSFSWIRNFLALIVLR